MDETTEREGHEAENGAEDGPAVPLSLARIIGYSLANLGYGAFYSLNNAVLPLYLKQFTADNRLIGLMGSTHSFEGAVIQPLVGSASDRLRTPLGRRRPFMLLFTPISVLFLLLTPAASHLSAHFRVGAMIAAIFLFTVFFNVAQDPYIALMPDITPTRQRGRVNGISMFTLVLGQALIVLVKMPLAAKFGLTSLLMIVTTLLTCVFTPEPSFPPEKGQTTHLAALKRALSGLRTLRQAARGLATLFFSGLGIGAVFPFLTIFVQTITRCSEAEAQRMFFVLLIATAIGVLPFGWLTDRIGPKPVLMIALSAIAIAAVNGLWVTTLSQITAVMALAGLGNAAQFAASYPLLTRLVPREEIGFYTGLQSTAQSIATPLTAVLTGSLVNAGGYRFIFVVCSASLLVAILILASVRPEAATSEITRRSGEEPGASGYPVS